MLKTFFFLSVFACSESNFSKQDQITKLRAIGVSTNPSQVSTEDIGKTINFSFILLSKQEEELQYTAEEVSHNRGVLPGLLNLVDSKNTDLGALQLYTVTATYPIPEGLPPGQPLRYGVRVYTETEEEKIVADLIVQKVPSPAFTPKIEIINPKADTSLSKEFDLELQIDDWPEEPLKISWFTSSGIVETFRAKKTKISEAKSGAITLVATVRGLNTGVFQYTVFQGNVP